MHCTSTEAQYVPYTKGILWYSMRRWRVSSQLSALIELARVEQKRCYMELDFSPRDFLFSFSKLHGFTSSLFFLIPLLGTIFHSGGLADMHNGLTMLNAVENPCRIAFTPHTNSLLHHRGSLAALLHSHGTVRAVQGRKTPTYHALVVFADFLI